MFDVRVKSLGTDNQHAMTGYGSMFPSNGRIKCHCTVRFEDACRTVFCNSSSLLLMEDPFGARSSKQRPQQQAVRLKGRLEW